MGFETRLNALAGFSGSPLSGARRGIEKESLRVTPGGELSSRTHPVKLGSALTNKYITTDFSEALLEFVTPAYSSTWEALRSICDIHQFTQQNIGDELLWASSMPCLLPDDSGIPLARYGTSNVGRMKTTYRRGLGYRYGRHMQTIAGVHFNFSLATDFWPAYQQALGESGHEEDFRSSQYLSMVRNFRRFGWIILYLFGSSPALCKSFAGDRKLNMPLMNGDTYFEQFGTSLRMSDLGYSNKNQSRIQISLNSLDEYIRDLSAAIHTPEPDYEAIGVLVDGKYRQLSANQLQIENEYYSAIRPKRVANSGERPTAALRRGGIEYVEIRSLDCNLFDPSGINQNTMRFVEAFLVYCLLEDSPLLDDALLEECATNQGIVAKTGRDPECLLLDRGNKISLRDWATQIVGDVLKVAALIDRDEDCYVSASKQMLDRVYDPDLTPSARILQDIRQLRCSFFEYALEAGKSHKAYFEALEPLPVHTAQELEFEAVDSLARQAAVEDADSISFEEYLAAFFEAD